MKTEVMDVFVDNSHNYLNSQSIQAYLQSLSGQEKRFNVIDVDHNYAKPWNRHPDGQIRAKAAKFLFMKNFPKHFRKSAITDDNIDIDVETVVTPKAPPFLSNPSLGSGDSMTTKTTLTASDLNSNELTTPSKTGWSTQMNKLWTKTMKTLHSDRLARLSYESLPNEVILKRNLMERTTNKFRHLFASVGWDVNLISWLNNTLNEYVGPVFLTPYHESMQCLRNKIPSLMDKFYIPAKYESSHRLKQSSDSIQSLLNCYKPKRINGSPLFLLVPNGPQVPHQMTSHRMKHWHNLFGSLGKVITISAIARPYETIFDFLNEIRYSVRDRIKECKATFNEGRPLVLVGFGHSSLVAAHCALDNASNVNATICLGFPLTAINGFRGDLDDPLLETTVPTLFVIGQNSTMATLDDMEDFRERITKTETGLAVVGGANDRLFVSNSKKKFEGITQSMVDRCIADEIYEFVTNAFNPNSTPVPSTSVRNSSNKSISFGSPGVTAIPKPRRRRPTPRDKDSDHMTKGRPRKKAKPDPKPEKKIPNPNISPDTKKSESTPISSTPHTKPIISIPKQPIPSTSAKTETPVTTSTPSKPPVPAIHDKVSKLHSEDSVTPDPNLSLSMDSNENANPVPNPVPKTERHYGLSYGISEMPTVISQSATRTGRQIRAPKALDV